MGVDTRELTSQLRVIESVAVMSSARSTNLLARRVIDECVNNEIALPSAVIVAREQTGGRGRGSRSWHSPAGRGIYATILHSLSSDRLSLLPLHIATLVAAFLRDSYGLDARIKWPNDILLGTKKIAGILIEARMRNGQAYTAIGVGINVAPVGAELIPLATSISEGMHGEAVSVEQATIAFIRSVDRGLAEFQSSDSLRAWSQLSIHRTGDAIAVRLANRELRGRWEGIDQFGRALIREGHRLHEISAADLILVE